MVPYFSGQSGTWYDISRTTAAVATNSFGLVGVTCSVAMYTYVFFSPFFGFQKSVLFSGFCPTATYE